MNRWQSGPSNTEESKKGREKMEGDNERRRSFVNKKTAPYIFLLPMILLFGVFMVYPVIKSLALSFYDFEGGDYLFCGINNYVTMCKDPVFWKSLGNTFI